MEDVSREVRIAVLENSKNQRQRFEGDDPVLGAADPLGDCLGAGGGVGLVGGDELENFGYVSIIERDFVMAGRLEHCNVEAGGTVGDLREANAGLIFHCADCLPKLARHRASAATEIRDED